MKTKELVQALNQTCGTLERENEALEHKVSHLTSELKSARENVEHLKLVRDYLNRRLGSVEAQKEAKTQEGKGANFRPEFSDQFDAAQAKLDAIEAFAKWNKDLMVMESTEWADGYCAGMSDILNLLDKKD